MTTPTPAPATSLSLTDIDAIAKVHASSYASPHHITFTVNGLREFLNEARGDALKDAARWIPVSERLPEVDEDGDSLLVLVYTPAIDGDLDRFDFDWICDGAWHNHNDSLEHFEAVGGAAAGGPGSHSTGPGETAPYTHWRALPTPPAAIAGDAGSQTGD